ncbi:MAG TPA: 3-keto-5-aminohexanoate cleavage protein [Acidimicrobiales bacterium]
MLLKACLNGARAPEDHPRLPVTPGELAADGAAVVAAGADAIHVHARDDDGLESLAPDDVAATVSAMRDVLRVPLGVTTGEWALPDPDERLQAVGAWSVLPDFASVNFHEPGAVELAELLLDRLVGVEAGLWTPEAARTLVASSLAPRCLRILIEPMDPTTEAAVATVDAIEAVLGDVAPDVPRLLHGKDTTAWDVLAEAGRRGYDTRIGLEDTLRMPDGLLAPDNGELVRAAVAHYRGAELET